MSIDDRRHKSGYASLAYEVLLDAKISGANMEYLKDNLWTQYLQWHTQAMRAGAIHKGGAVIVPKKHYE